MLRKRKISNQLRGGRTIRWEAGVAGGSAIEGNVERVENVIRDGDCV
jgi:hypothetical protein